ncbi:DUF6434 domain-containing protein [Paraburkholderia sp. SIMBA_053]|uniref:DUF6434 domain-containing protein n=1 Tax=Paraburkholderia sp. SIMBA_053 TaxID=3085794 RepID=UPI00397C0AFA
MKFDWHRDPINRATKIDETYKNTQNVRRFLTSECGKTFRFDRSFMAWIKSGAPRNMGEVADEWIRLRKVGVDPITEWHSLCPRSYARTAMGRPCDLLSPRGAIRDFHVPLAKVRQLRRLLLAGGRMGHEDVYTRRRSHLHYLLVQA